MNAKKNNTITLSNNKIARQATKNYKGQKLTVFKTIEQLVTDGDPVNYEIVVDQVASVLKTKQSASRIVRYYINEMVKSRVIKVVAAQSNS